MVDFRDDVRKVVKAVHGGPYKGVALTSIIGFPTDAAADLQTIGEAADRDFHEVLARYTDPRLLFASAQ